MGTDSGKKSVRIYPVDPMANPVPLPQKVSIDPQNVRFTYTFVLFEDVTTAYMYYR